MKDFVYSRRIFMYLKRLETVGFKSFAERIQVEFVPGVTAVVGPNGSGKSNISDAVRWVLGEQSARQLRGSKMEDIIFQGSDTRKALNVAEVTLVLDNQDQAVPLDYEEVSVMRRMYRSGESEFYINKQSCRLKDIIDLFMDSGLGREAYSIISQGKVEEILSSKAEERRTIFEEAAGVLKYKQRKRKAEYKLAETQENLNRVEDIIHENEQQLTPLRKQAETAEQYLRLKEELKQNEIALLLTEIEQLHTQWQELLQQIEKNKMTEINLKTTIQEREALVEKQKQDIADLDEEVEKLQENLLQVTEQLENYQGKKRLLHERTKHFGENKRKLESQKEETAVKIAELKNEWEIEHKNLAELQEMRKQTKQQLNDLKTKLSTNNETISETIEDLKADYIEYLNKQAAKRNEKQSITSQLQQITEKRDRQQEKFQGLTADREQLSVKKKQLETTLTEQEKFYSEKTSHIQQLKKEIEINRQEYQESQTKLYQGYQYIEKLKSRKEMLEEMKTEFQGFFQGVRAVLKANENGQLHGIHGAVIELIDVPKSYLTAIETVLGGQAQHIITVEDQAARKAIAWLKQTNQGRATFLPLESIKERFITTDIRQKIENHPGFIGIAANLVDTKPNYQKAINHLMGHVIISKTLKDANEIAKLALRRFKVVTVEGDVVNPGGSMSGGAKKKTNQSLFTREKDLQEITEKLDGFKGKISSFEKKLSSQKQIIAKKESQLETEEQSLTDQQQKLQQLRSENKEMEMKLSTVNDNLSIYDQDNEQYKQDSDQLYGRDQQLTGELDEIKRQLESVQKEIDALTEQRKVFEENRENLQDDYHRSQVVLAEQEERVKNSQDKTNKLKEELTALEEQYALYKSELSTLLDLEKEEETEAEIDETIQRKQTEKQNLNQTIQKKRTKRSDETKRQEDEERELKEENKYHQAYVQEIQQKEVKANRLDVELENRLTHLQTEYTITYEKAKQTYRKTENTVEAKSVVQKLKNSIDQLGAVNLGAMDEFERVQERHTFLTEQKNDLTTAKQTLYTVIDEMDQEMIKRFDETFNQIKAEFSQVFKQLFGGGHAELTLTDPKNLLETGVDIIAQPPGKKLQHLGLLSGGERALTAIALLFAILQVRPVPFCILDEVEAALDEANVSRFAKYIKLFSEKTQFIVITHRKGTMEEADVLYGVTMQESGVSRLVSVRLEETKELMNS